MGARTHYVSVDVEASGPVPGLYSMLSLGATLITVPGKGDPKLGPSFYVELKPLEGAASEPVHLAHAGGLDPTRLVETGVEPGAAMARLAAWLESEGVRRPIFVAHCANFDWMFVAWYFARFGMPNPFGFAALDTKAMAVGRLRAAFRDTGTEQLAKKLGIPPQDPATVHHAGHDAAWQATLFLALLRADPG